VATAGGTSDGNRSGETQGWLVEQTRLKIRSLKLAVFERETALLNAAGNQPACDLLSEP
jgi:hypothetical protein